MKKQRGSFRIMAELIRLVAPLRLHMCLAILLGLLGHLAATFITVAAVYGLLAIALPGSAGGPAAWFIVMAVLALIRGLLRYGEQTFNHYIAFKLLAVIRDRVFAVLRRLAPAKLEGRDKGNLIALITADIELLEVFYAHTISPVAIYALYSLVICIFLATFHVLVALAALAAYLVIGIAIPLFIAARGRDDAAQFREESGELGSFLLDSLRGLGETLQFGASQRRREALDERSRHMDRTTQRMKQREGRNNALSEAAVMFFNMLMLILLLVLHRHAQLSPSAVLICFCTLISSYGPAIALSNLGSGLQNTLACGRRVLDLLGEEPVAAEITGCPSASFAKTKVDSLEFAYRDKPILRGVDLTIQPGEIIGLRGPSGSGKSTLLRLLMRFWEPDKGSIHIGEREIRQINSKDLRRMESFVTQDAHLFSDSIRDNLLIAKPDATDKELERACRMASVHDFIMSLPEGYDSRVAELGDSLSGGERQRIGLARAFLHDADLLLLDEPTGNLDSLNEAVILKALRDAGHGKTILMVSHRLSTLRGTDRILEIQDGRLK